MQHYGTFGFTTPNLKGKPVERLGRKATWSTILRDHDCKAAGFFMARYSNLFHKPTEIARQSARVAPVITMPSRQVVPKKDKRAKS